MPSDFFLLMQIYFLASARAYLIPKKEEEWTLFRMIPGSILKLQEGKLYGVCVCVLDASF